MYHYTYLIQHRASEMRYIGKRSSKVPPLEDTHYWGSSKHLPKNVQEDHVKIIIKEHLSAKAAIAHEIELHRLNDVAVNPTYYNRAKQTSVGFDTTGTTLIFTQKHKDNIGKANKGVVYSDEVRARMSEAQKAKYRNGYIHPNKGKPLNKEVLTKMINTKITQKVHKGIKNIKFKPWFISYPDRTDLFYDITKQDKAVMDNLPYRTYLQLSQRSKGIRPITKGPFKGLVIGNIPKQ